MNSTPADAKEATVAAPSRLRRLVGRRKPLISFQLPALASFGQMKIKTSCQAQINPQASGSIIGM
jgi:hypothetical protein